jgi:hypothetical protein
VSSWEEGDPSATRAGPPTRKDTFAEAPRPTTDGFVDGDRVVRCPAAAASGLVQVGAELLERVEVVDVCAEAGDLDERAGVDAVQRGRDRLLLAVARSSRSRCSREELCDGGSSASAAGSSCAPGLELARSRPASCSGGRRDAVHDEAGGRHPVLLEPVEEVAGLPQRGRFGARDDDERGSGAARSL